MTMQYVHKSICVLKSITESTQNATSFVWIMIYFMIALNALLRR